MAESTEPICDDVVLARYVFNVEVKCLGIQFPSLDFVLGTGVHESQIGMIGSEREMDVSEQVLILVESIMYSICFLLGGMPTLFNRRESFGNEYYRHFFVLVLLVYICAYTILRCIRLYAYFVIGGVADPEQLRAMRYRLDERVKGVSRLRAPA